MTRHIDFEGVENFRDFGGYATACGRGVKRGVLFRSANHHRATDADLEAMKALGVKVIVDLRRAVEREREPSRRWTGFDAQVIENDIEDASHLDWVDFLKGSDLSADFFRQDGLTFYRRAPLEARHVDLFRRYFEALADGGGPVLVHCAAGKDRTGMICAFTHHIAGVSRDDILADYLLTNDEARIGRRAELFARWVFEITGRTIADHPARIAQSVDVAYLETALATIDESHGSLDAYLENALGVDEARRAKIHDRLLG
jgi:protein tyrosine/serine phosphatase